VLSPLSARKAEKLGYKNIRVFHAGLPAWKKAGHVVVSNTAGLDNLSKMDASYILIDLREASEVAKGHIPKAVAVPPAGLEALKDQFPTYKNAAVILYNGNGEAASAKEAFKTISSWGYTQVSVLAGGFKAWESEGKQVAAGPAASNVSYVRKLMPGEEDIEAFKAVVQMPGADTLILDVRATAEVAEGALPNSKNVPLDELEQRLSDLPKDKNIVVHCSTGARAEMAYNVLKKAGYRAKFVKAKVEFDKEKKGNYAIIE